MWEWDHSNGSILELNRQCNPSFYRGDQGPEGLGHLVRDTEEQNLAQCSSYSTIKIDSVSQSNFPQPHSGQHPSWNVISVPLSPFSKNGINISYNTVAIVPAG